MALAKLDGRTKLMLKSAFMAVVKMASPKVLIQGLGRKTITGACLNRNRIKESAVPKVPRGRTK